MSLCTHNSDHLLYNYFSIFMQFFSPNGPSFFGHHRAKLMNIGHFRKKSIFNFCTTISSNRQEFRIKIDESESKMPEDRIGTPSRSTRQPEIA